MKKSILGWFKSILRSKNTRTQISGKEMTADDYRDISFGEIRKYIQDNYPPYTWARVGMRLYKEFLGYGLNFSTVKDRYIIPKELLKKIDDTLFNLYNKRISEDFIKIK